MQYRYYGSGSHMSADLKRVIHAVRTKRPDLFVVQEIKESTMDSDGRVTVTVRKEARAVPQSAERRHKFSLQPW